MVLLIIIPIKWLFHWEYTLFSDKPIYSHNDSAFERLLGHTSAPGKNFQPLCFRKEMNGLAAR